MSKGTEKRRGLQVSLHVRAALQSSEVLFSASEGRLHLSPPSVWEMEKLGARERKEEPRSLEGTVSNSWLLRSPENGGIFFLCLATLTCGRCHWEKGKTRNKKIKQTVSRAQRRVARGVQR